MTSSTPVVVRGGTPSQWPALVQWRDLGGNFLHKLGQPNPLHRRRGRGGGGGEQEEKYGVKIEVKVRERKRLGGGRKKDKQGKKNSGQHYGEAFFYDGHWQQTSQMGMASLVQDDRSGDYDVVAFNGGIQWWRGR